MKSRSPVFESLAARLGVAIFVALSAWIGYQYWSSRGEESLAVATVGAELIAFAGLAIARHNWRGARFLAFLGVLVTVLAASWCGFTTWQKIAADTRSQALQEAQQKPDYIFASRALSSASSALESQLQRQPPGCACPDTIRAWEASQRGAINSLTLERDTAQARLDLATPRPQMDWIAAIRGVGMEAVKLLGFMVFGLAISQPPKAPPNVATEPIPIVQAATPPWYMRTAAALLALFVSQARAPASADAQTLAQPRQASDPIVLNAAHNAKAIAFSMRGRYDLPQIAAKVGVHRTTVYRWFRARDNELSATG